MTKVIHSPTDSKPLIAAIEAGGTKFICALARAGGEVLDQTRIETRDPASTLSDCAAFFQKHLSEGVHPAAVGIASFGPLNLDTKDKAFGSIISTPKPGWSGVQLLRFFADLCHAPVAIDTDVNAAALAEERIGAAQGCDTFCYMTVGTGIGVGIVQAGRTLSSPSHGEVGHMRIPRHPDDDFPGVCSYHGDCAEGLASGPAIAERWGTSAAHLPDDHPAWAFEAYYLAALCNNLIYMFRPERIIIGGGVMIREGLLDKVRVALKEMMAGYALSAYEQDLSRLIVPPALDIPPPGLLGAVLLGEQVLETQI